MKSIITRQTTLNQQIKLSNGRILGYDEYGDPKGKPIVFMHGFPSSRLDWQMFDPDNMALELNARIIAIDRPGMGLSDFQSDRELLDWPDDVIELMDILQVDQFNILALSGGGPYGAACAFKIPERLCRTALICGMGPGEAPGAKSGGSWSLPGKPALLRKLMLIMFVQAIRNKPERVELQFIDMVSKTDRELFAIRPELLQMIIGSCLEAFRAGIGGVQHEATLYTRPWGFRLQDIKGEVHLWHGGDDNNVPYSVGKYVAMTIPNCWTAFLDNEGHFTLPYNHMRQILSNLIE